jgi:hypothetical protein
MRPRIVTEVDRIAAEILAHYGPDGDDRAWLAVSRIHARIRELEPLMAFGGSLGAVYAAEVSGLRFALELLGEDEQ